jgi:pimeloyl-ACP methyl ester carboxylesterase
MVMAVLLSTGLVYTSLVAVPQSVINRPRHELTVTPVDAGLYFEDFVLSPADSTLKLKGWWMPAETPMATLVFIHGGGSSRHSGFFSSVEFYRAMVEQQISVVAIDLRNHGQSDSDGNGLQFGRTEMRDAQAAISWAHTKSPSLPIFAMGISMGGATLIQAVHDDADITGLILLDSVLDTEDTVRQSGWVETGMPPALFAPSAWAAVTFFDLPGGEHRPLELASKLDLPILAMQDPDDPVTRAHYSTELARRNPNVTLWSAPTIAPDHPDLAFKGRWGSHVAAFAHHPEQTLEQIMQFINRPVFHAEY